MKLQILKKADLEQARAIWQHLETAVPDITLASKWVWIQTWIDVYGDFIPFQFIVAEEHGKPCGIVLVAKETGRPLPFPVKSYSIGTGGEPLKERTHMLNKSILVLPKYKDQFIELLVESISGAYSWEELTLDFYRVDDQKKFLEVFDKKRMKYHTIPEAEYIRDLKEIRDSGKSVMDSLASNTKYKIRRSLKGFGDDVTVEYAKSVGEAVAFYDEMTVLHQKVWESRGKRGMFESKRFTRFHRELIEKLTPTGGAVMLKVASCKFGTIGCVYLFVENRDATLYQTGFNTFEGVTFENNTNKNKIKPGLVSHALCMEVCMKELDVDIYNFGPAEYQYKAELTDKQRGTSRVSVHKGIKPYVRDTFWDLYVKADNNKAAKAIIQPLYTIYKKLA